MSSGLYFAEDSVYRINPDRSVEFGLVIKGGGCSHGGLEGPVAGASAIKKRLPVLWGPRGQSGIVCTEKVKLHDRAFVPGDVVTRDVAPGPLGYIRKRKVIATVQIVGTDRVITGVNTADLEPIENVSTNMVAYHEGKVCLVLEVKRELTVRFADGSVCIVKHEDTDYLEEVKERGRCVDMFYRGQRLCGPVRCFENAHFLHRTKANQLLMSYSERAPLQVVVDYVTVVELTVQDLTGPTAKSPAAFRVIQGRALERVKVVNAFESCAVVVGDYNYYQVRDSDVIISLADWQKQCVSKYSPPQDRGDESLGALTGAMYANKAHVMDHSDLAAYASFSQQSSSVPLGLSPVRRSRVFRRGKPSGSVRWPKKLQSWTGPAPQQPSVESNSTVVTVVLATTSTVDVIWEDGSVGKDIPATELRPSSWNATTTFLPGKFVVENIDNAPPDRYGVVKSFDSPAKTAVISLFKIFAANVNPVELGEKEVSLYDLKEHTSFNFVRGSCVLRRAYHSDGPEWMVGQVVDLYPEAGGVEVRWAAGWVSLCYPHELYHVGRYEHLWLKANEEADDDIGASHCSSPSQILIVNVPPGGSVSASMMAPPSPHSETATVPLGPSLAMSTEVEVWNNNSAAPATPLEAIPEEFASLNEVPVVPAAPREPQEDVLMQIKYLEFSVTSLEHSITKDANRHTCASLRRLVDLFHFYKRLDFVANVPYLHQRILLVLIQCVRLRGRPVPRRLSTRLRQILLGYLKDHPPPLEEKEELMQEGGGAVEEEPAPQGDAHGRRELEWRSLELEELCHLLAGLLRERLEGSRNDYEALFKRTFDVAVQYEGEAEQGEQDGDAKADTTVKDGSAMETDAEGDGAKDGAEKAASDEVKEDPLSGELSRGTPGVFTVVETVPDGHRFKFSRLEVDNLRDFARAVKREMNLLMTSLPDGIHVKAYGDRMDVYSVMIRGPRHTPYEDALFLFDVKLPADYPHSPPLCQYLSFSKDRLNPNLYEDGKVCLSLLGTWPGQQKVETWSPGVSNLLQLLVSIQGLILVAEPHFLEPGFEREKGSATGAAKSRQYNELAVILIVQAMVRMLRAPPEVFKEEIKQHFKEYGARFISRREGFLDLPYAGEVNGPPEDSGRLPGFPLLPATRGFCLSLRQAIDNFKGALDRLLAPVDAPGAGK